MSTYDKFSDLELIVLLKASDEVAYAEIYRRFKDLLFLHAYRMLQDEDVAKDVVQEVFISIWDKREEINVSALDGYLYSSIRNRILNIISHQKVVDRYMSSLNDYLEQGIALTDEWIREKELIKMVEEEIAKLPPKMREVFELSRNQQLSHKQIGELLGISDQTVKKHVNNALKILRSKLHLAIFLYFLN